MMFLQWCHCKPLERIESAFSVGSCCPGCWSLGLLGCSSSRSSLSPLGLPMGFLMWLKSGGPGGRLGHSSFLSFWSAVTWTARTHFSMSLCGRPVEIPWCLYQELGHVCQLEKWGYLCGLRGAQFKREEEGRAEQQSSLPTPRLPLNYGSIWEECDLHTTF